MSNTIMILGESGTGKSTAIRTLNAKETFIISVLDKPLPFRGYKNLYSVENKNYYASDNWAMIIEYIQAINERRPDIRQIIIDDFQYILAHEFMNRASEKSFEKFTEIAHHAWSIIRECIHTRADLKCFLLTHSDTDTHGKSKAKTIGKLLEEKITLEGMFTIVLHSLYLEGQYKFLTSYDGSHIAKSPMGMFADKYIDNDLGYVCKQIDAYFDTEDNIQSSFITQ